MPTTARELTAAARLFHALSDETRLGILEMLRDGERCVCDLQAELDAAQSRLSFHLRVLREAGLVVALLACVPVLLAAVVPPAWKTPLIAASGVLVTAALVMTLRRDREVRAEERVDQERSTPDHR